MIHGFERKSREMQEIKCPHCNKVFQVDESGYAQIVQQIRDKEFNAELERRTAQLIEGQRSKIEIARMEQEKEFDAAIAVKEAAIREKDSEIAALKAKLSTSETDKKLAVSEAIRKKESELSDKTTEIVELKGELQRSESENQLKKQAIIDKYEETIKQKDEQIEYYKDFKARQSTKMVGESLEQHCEIEFNKIRMAAFPNAYFEKDNDAKSGSKGDFIFREYSEDGTEFISIMFEMKNEMDTTATKHKNEDFFKELDKDRNEKGCEYAVLVSLLEIDNEFYNGGIVDVSHKYDKMYVIRPQFFVPMITLLRNAARNSLQYRRELQMMRNQQLDISHFEENMNAFKAGFARNYDLATRQLADAINGIDNTIKYLNKVKDSLLSSGNNLRLANKKADDLSIKRLTKNAPSVKAMFDRINENNEFNE